jgi:hypothetical protein
MTKFIRSGASVVSRAHDRFISKFLTQTIFLNTSQFFQTTDIKNNLVCNRVKSS